MTQAPMTLDAFLAGQPGVDARLATVVGRLAAVARDLSGAISRGPLAGEMGGLVGENTDGDAQKALDVIADDAFAAALGDAGVRWYASEERDTVVELAPEGPLAVAIDPLDGSSNIDVNVSIGTIFSVRAAAADGPGTFLRAGRDQLAAGYFIYGPQTALVFATAAGAAHFVLDRARGVFALVTRDLTIPGQASEFAINASNYRHWPAPVRAYIDDCLAGEEGPRGKNFNMRWVASLVAETHRILMRGGIFLYPSDDRPKYAKGRLRMVYECAPIAYVVERAGGRATDALDAILDAVPESLHARTPFVFGSADKVARVAAYHDLPPSEVSPLFGRRGLFTA